VQKRRLASSWIAVAAIALLFACGDMRQDELDCEEAVSHLQDCCPHFDSSKIDCTYTSACSTTYPAISIPQSACIRSQSCSQLVSAGVCGRAQSAWPVTDRGTTSNESSPDTVCP
jgi:hypothetical protein